MKAWTDYPIEELGDIPGNEAPVRRCKIVSYDGDKYCRISVNGARETVKRGYLYRKMGRCGDVPCVWRWRLRLLPKTTY